jgi:hypothetical protein
MIVHTLRDGVQLFSLYLYLFLCLFLCLHLCLDVCLHACLSDGLSVCVCAAPLYTAACMTVYRHVYGLVATINVCVCGEAEEKHQ